MFISSLLSNPLQTLIQMLYRVPAVLIALTLHEAAHGLMAYWLGDSTAKASGRISLNPLRHLDLMGMLMLLFLGFGWAKPVPVNPNRLKKPKRDGMLVALAGPLVNFITFVAVFLFTLLLIDFTTPPVWVLTFLQYLYSISLFLCLFNLIPVPPLDGYHVLSGVARLNPYPNPRTAQICMLLLFGLSFTGILGQGLQVVSGFLTRHLFQLYVLARGII